MEINEMELLAQILVVALMLCIGVISLYRQRRLSAKLVFGQVEGTLEIQTSLGDDGYRYVLTSIIIPKEFSLRYQLEPPKHFITKKYSESLGPEDDKDSVIDAMQWDLESTQWCGNVELKPNSKTKFCFTYRGEKPKELKLKLGCEKKTKFDSTFEFVDVELKQ
jgi:hypothetical protein